MQFEKAIEEFTGYEKEKKRATLLSLLTVFQGYGDVIERLLVVAKQETTTEETMLDIYNIIVNAIDEVKVSSFGEEVDKVASIKKLIEDIRKQEQEEKKLEDPDTLLQSIR